MNKYFDLSEKVYDVTNKYPVLIDLLAGEGFEPLKNEAMRNTMGRMISIEKALRSKGINPQLFEEKMVEVIERDILDKSDNNGGAKVDAGEGAVVVKGAVPCPIRMQLIDGFEEFVNNNKLNVSYDLNAASMGIDSIESEVLKSKSADDLSDIYMSAGFDLFFDNGHMGKYKDMGVFRDFREGKLNSDLDNDEISLKDPKGYYSVIGVVPAVFIVNKKVLGDRPIPEKWSDLFKEEYENSLSLPMRDLDMFNAILMGIYSKYGRDGIYRLGRAVTNSMHPAEMVKNAGKIKGAPAVTIMPYFFSNMILNQEDVVCVWPKDGAVASPIFLLTKESSYEKAKPVIDFLFSDEVAEMMGVNGAFPQTNPNYDNKFNGEKKLIFPGWDLLHNEDVGALLAELEEIFKGNYGSDEIKTA